MVKISFISLSLSEFFGRQESTVLTALPFINALPHHEKPASPPVVPLTPHARILSPHALLEHAWLSPQAPLAHTTDLLFYPTPTQCTLKKKRKKNRSGQTRIVLSLSQERAATRVSLSSFQVSMPPMNTVATGQWFQKLLANMQGKNERKKKGKA